MDKIEKIVTDITRFGAKKYNQALRNLIVKNPKLTSKQIVKELEKHQELFNEMDSSPRLGFEIPTFEQLYEMGDKAERYFDFMTEEDFDNFLEYTAERSRKEEGITKEQVLRYTNIGKNGKRK